jgi:hypothetical protein
LPDDPSAQTPPIKRKRHASIDGFDLHAGAPVPSHDRNRLERLLRYLLRPPIAESRMRLIALIDQPAVIQKILKHLGLPADIFRARPPPSANCPAETLRCI